MARKRTAPPSREARVTGSLNFSITSFMNAVLVAEIARLTPAEKLQLVEELWDEIAASEDRLPIPDWHRAVLNEDQARYGANPTEGSPWPEVKARLLHPS